MASRDGRLGALLAEGEAVRVERILAGTEVIGVFRLLKWRLVRAVLLWVEGRMLRGIIAHYLVRKRWIEAAVRAGISEGVKGVVVIAAGYDTLCQRLCEEFPEVGFVEMDHPATQEGKVRVFPQRGNLSYIGADMNREKLSALGESGERGVYVMEGLTMYLDEEGNAELFREIAKRCGRLVFTFMRQEAGGSICFSGQSGWVGRWLQRRGEPFLWGISGEDLPGFLEGCGLRCLEVVDDERLREEILVPAGLGELPLAQGECICVAEPI